MNKAELIKALAELLAEKMQLGEEPTNGEVIQAVFPNINIIGTTDKKEFFVLDLPKVKEWWNATYKAEKGASE